MDQTAPATSSPIGRLSNELLSSILLQFKLGSSAPSLLPCLLCCKAWYSVALPLLYHDVRLTNPNLEPFLKYFSVSASSLVRSLTLYLDDIQPELQADAPHPYAFVEDEDDMQRSGSQGSKRLWGHLRDVATKVAKMVGLVTFSLYTSHKPRNVGFWLPRPTIAAIVEALPESCVNLEIDTRGRDTSPSGSVHLCAAVRATLPRLRNLRLRLDTMCPAMFGDDFDPNDPAKFFSNYRPLATSSLQTVLVNCAAGSMFSSRASICGPSQESLYNEFEDRNPRAYFAMVDSLRLGVERHCYPAAKRICVIQALEHDSSEATFYPTLVRRDILANQTSALPFKNNMGSERDNYIVRMLEGEEILTDAWVVDAVIEDQFWGETIDGYRLPATLLGKEHTLYAVKPLPFETRES
jgi:F-box-like